MHASCLDEMVKPMGNCWKHEKQDFDGPHKQTRSGVITVRAFPVCEGSCYRLASFPVKMQGNHRLLGPRLPEGGACGVDAIADGTAHVDQGDSRAFNVRQYQPQLFAGTNNPMRRLM
jgi:hypothetical protein